jgi:Ca-activated chloride channel family protein
MQRTVVLYAAAIVTLIGAFFLVPRLDEPPAPEPPPPPPAPVADNAITRLSYADAAVQVDARLDRGHILVQNGMSDGEQLYMDVGVKAVAAGNRAPLAAVLVIDRSGSMAGDKIDQARMAAERFVGRLQAGDQLAIISYGTDVSVDMPLQRVDSQSKTRARRVINAIEEGGGTNIDGALRVARRTLQRAGSISGVARVVLISDGRPTEGSRSADKLASHSASLRDAGATVSTLGLGLDYNEDLMERLAIDGAGRYHYLRRARELSSILDDELKHASSVVARGVKLFVKAPAGLSFADAPGTRFVNGRAGVEVDLGDLASGEERRVLLAFKPANISAPVALAAPELTYVPALADGKRLLSHRSDTFRVVPTDDGTILNAGRRDEVRVRVLEVLASVELTESMNAYREGRVDEARKILRRNKARVSKAATETKSARLLEEAKNLGAVLDEVQANAPSSAKAQDIVKHQKARAYSVRR